MAEAAAVGVDVGGTKLLAALVTAEGQVHERIRADTPGDGSAIAGLIVDLVTKLMADHGSDELPIGVGAAGMLSREGALVFAPNIDWAGFPLKRELQRRLGLPVEVENDANAAAWGEFCAGAGRAARDGMVMLTVGTGVGGGLVAGGALFRGAHGLAAEFGHLIVNEGGPRCGCGNHGCLEALASGTAIGRIAREAAAAGRVPTDSALHGAPHLTGKAVTAAAQGGDSFAKGILAECGRWLGVGIASLVNALDPELVVVGGGGMQAGELLLSPAREAFGDRVQGRDHRSPPDIVAAALGDDAGIIGASLLALSASAAQQREA